jgi:hypothetical protein
MSTEVGIGLTQLVLWYDATRIQVWPAFLAQIPADLRLPSATDFGRRFDTERMTDRRHAAAEKIVRNLPGLERREDRLVLKGIGLLTKTEQGYTLSRDGAELRNSYLADPKGKAWQRLLARLLLLREPRTRVLVRLMSQLDATLVFDGDDWFAGSIRKAYIETDSARVYVFVGDHPRDLGLRTILREHSWWALGQWRADNLLAGATNCFFTGTLQKELSFHDISLALRGPLELLFHLGVLEVSSNKCRLNTVSSTHELGSDIAADFGWSSGVNKEDVEALLHRLLADLRSDTGYIIASELRRALLHAGIANPDAEIARLQTEDRLVIEAEDYGQARHGEGLFGDPRKQMVQIRLVSRSHA